MGLVHKEDEVLGKVVQKAGRRLALLATVHVAGVVFNAVAVAELLEHFQIELGALFKALGLEKLSLLFEMGKPLLEFHTNVCTGALQVVLLRDVVACWIEHCLFDPGKCLPRERVNLAHRVYVVAKVFDAQGLLVTVGRDDFNGVPAHAKRSPVKVVVVALVLDVHKALHELFHGQMLAFLNGNDKACVVLRGTQAVDAGHRGHDDHVPAGEQGMGCRVAQLVYVVVDGAVLGDIGVRSWHIGLGLVVVVVAYEVLDSVFGEEFAKLRVELGSKGLVGRNDKGRPATACYDVCHGKGLAGACDAKQHLIFDALFQIGGKGLNGLWLIACWLVGADQFEHGEYPVENKGVKRVGRLFSLYKPCSCQASSCQTYPFLQGKKGQRCFPASGVSAYSWVRASPAS